eukprot:gene16265-biopygen13818
MINHKSGECDRVTSIAERKKILSSKRLCFNCTGSKHRASECHSKIDCQKCKGRHHTSICDKGADQVLVATGERTVIYPVVIVKVDGIKCRALLDTGAGSSYMSATLSQLLNKKPSRTEHRQIEMMMHSTSKKIDIYAVTVENLKENFQLNVNVSKVDKPVLLSLPNPNYEHLIKTYKYLEGVKMDDTDTKSELPIHMILGASEYSKIKMNTKPRVGQPGQPVAEQTTLGWSLISPGADSTLDNVYLTQSSTADYEKLCNLDVLGLQDRSTGDQMSVYDEFKSQLIRSPEGWYETGLLWKAEHAELHNNENGSMGRLSNLVRRLKRNPELFDEYDKIIQDQLAEGIIEKAPSTAEGKEFYIPHKPVVRELAESTKTRIVYDASARANDNAPSLNDCLETGPPLQNLIWSIFVRNRFKPVALAGDLQKAFLQVRIREQDRDALRFHWIKNKDPSQVEVYRFTRALFGLVQSPFLLGGTIEEHLKSCESEYPEEVKEIWKSLYVDDVITGANNVQELQHLKESAVEIFGRAQFKLHKWHSNISALENEDTVSNEECTYAKQQLGVKVNETKMLGLTWNKNSDTLKVTFPREKADVTKRGILRFLATIFDPLGIASPITLSGKEVYRTTCDENVPWDKNLPEIIQKQWEKFENKLPVEIEVPRSLVAHQEQIEKIDLHVFGDTSGTGTAAVAYAVVYQKSGISQGLIAARSRLAKKGLTIPRLELVSAHMAANLAQNIIDALEGFPIQQVTGWLDSTVALHWIRGDGNYKQFVANRVKKIREKNFIQWRYIPTKANPADVASRGITTMKLGETWWIGPSWLPESEQWPGDKVTEPNKETEAEAKMIKQVLATTMETQDVLLKLLEKHSFWKTIRISAWIARFLHNCKAQRGERMYGHLTTHETEKQIQLWVKREQKTVAETEAFKQDRLRLNLQQTSDGIYICQGRIQGVYPVYLPMNRVFSEKLVMDAHLRTLHGGVGLTMTEVRRQYWIPRLRQLTKRVIRNCNGCKRFQAVAFNAPSQGQLPVDRTRGSIPFQVIGIDYAGPLKYVKKAKQLGKAYILLFSCSLTRALYLEILPNQSVQEFLKSFKRFVARKGRPDKIYSDNGRTFVAASKWLHAKS